MKFKTNFLIKVLSTSSLLFISNAMENVVENSTTENAIKNTIKTDESSGSINVWSIHHQQKDLEEFKKEYSHLRNLTINPGCLNARELRNFLGTFKNLSSLTIIEGWDLINTNYFKAIKYCHNLKELRVREPKKFTYGHEDILRNLPKLQSITIIDGYREEGQEKVYRKDYSTGELKILRSIRTVNEKS